MVNSEKRSTRSQTTISDHFSRVQLDLSPLKQARSAMRNADIITAMDSPDAGSYDVASCKKRLASPPTVGREESVEREFKRSKMSGPENEVRELPALGLRLEPFPSLHTLSTLPPPSVSGSTTPTRSIGSSPRARSVPPSIPTTPGQVPYLDLSKYRSPMKSAHRVRVMSVPPSSPPIRGAEEREDALGMWKGVERDSDQRSVPRMVVEKVERVRRVMEHPPPTLVMASNLDSQNDDPFSHEFNALPGTPVQKNPLSVGSMSPLTPLSSFPSLPSIEYSPVDPMNIDPPASVPQPQAEPPTEPKPEPRPALTKQSSHLIPPQPTPLSFPLPSRSPTPPSQRVSRSRSVSVEPPIPTLPYPLLPSTSNTSSGHAPDPEPAALTVSKIPDPQPPEKPVSPQLPEPNKEAKEQVQGPSKLPAAKSTKTSRLRSTMANAGPGGVTRTRATKRTSRPTPISRERRVTRSSTAKSRQTTGPLHEEVTGPVSTTTQSDRGGGESGTTVGEREGKDGNAPGIEIICLSCDFEREPDIRVPTFQLPCYRRLRQSHGNRWALLYPPPVRRQSRGLPLQQNPSHLRIPSRLLEDPVNQALRLP